ncbi:MAG: VWA domain-containing protein [Candidatus Spechtbacteria bacterium]|nr:VWA domain-containing protein [Candidatus Spechtbacteria bacterium]
MEVEFPYAVIGLMVLPLIAVFIAREARKQRDVRKALHEDHERVERDALLKFILSCVALVSLIIIMAQPYFIGVAAQKGISGQYVFVVDTSTSMAAREGPSSPSQLDRAKSVMQKIIDGVPEACFGVFLFSKLTFPVSSVTCDRDILWEVITHEMVVDRIPERGSDIINALRVAAKRIFSSEMYKDVSHIILLTDGGSGYSSGAIDQMIDEFQAQHLKLVVMGVGSKNGAPIPLVDEDGIFTGSYATSNGKEYFSFLQSEWLRNLAAQTNGIYLEQYQDDELVNILRSELKDTGQAFVTAPQKQDLGWIFFIPLGISFFVLLWRRNI